MRQKQPLGGYLDVSPIADWDQPDVAELARKLTGGKSEVEAVRACFEWFVMKFSTRSITVATR